jgi:SAM-dependent methyltransferase
MNVKDFFGLVDLREDVRTMMKEHFSLHLQKQMVAYDVGCGDKPFAKFLEGKVEKYIGVDIEDGFYDSSHIDLIGSAYEVPVSSETADAVISSQVIEHLNKPLDAIKEAHRILKPSGLFFLSFPFLYPMHAAPHDYMRYTDFYIIGVLKEIGFEVIDVKTIGGFWYCLGLYSGIYVQTFDKGLLKKVRIGKLINVTVRWIFFLLHKLEGTVLKAMKKDIEGFRKNWTVNYVLVARKMRGS